MPRLDEKLEQIQQRSGSNTLNLRSDGGLTAFAVNTKKDIASIVDQLNNVYKPLVEGLSSTSSLNALDFGLSGNVLFTHINATAASALAFYDTAQARPRTVKETVDVLISEIARLETEIDRGISVDAYDDAELRALINKNDLNLKQLKLDAMGSNYTFDNDGVADLTYPLSQHIDAIGTFFSGFPTTGNTYTATYPSLALSVLLSQITIDTTLSQSVISGLTADLNYIRTFIGMDTTGPETPTYTDHGAVTTVSDGDSLEEAIQKLDVAVAAVSTVDLQEAFDNGNEITVANGTGAGVVLNGNDSTSDNLIELNQTVSRVALQINSSSTDEDEPGIHVDLDSIGGRAFIATDATGSVRAALVDSRTSGVVTTGPSAAAYFYRNRAAAQTAGPVVSIKQDHASDDQVALYIQQDASGVNALQVSGDGYVDRDFEITGKLTVAGLIDPTGLVVDYQASNPAGTIASKGTFWARNDDTPMFTDGSGVDYELNGGAAHASTHITGGSDEIDGDQLDIDFTPTFYTPTTAPAEASDLDHLAAHLAGIDVAIGAAGGSGGETLTQTLTLGNTTGGVDIEISSGDAIVGENNGAGAGGNIVFTTGDGSTDAGNVLIQSGAAHPSGHSAYFGINTASPSFAFDLDVSSGYTYGSEAGAGLGNVWVGSRSATFGAITHRSNAGSATDFALSLTSAGGTNLNAATGQEVKVTLNGSSTITKFNTNGLVLGSQASDPTGENGAMYYNSTDDLVRVYENGAWGSLRAFSTTSNITSNTPGDTTADDFVFGSTVLESPAASGYVRFQFDKSLGSFRAGQATGTEWNAANSGLYSAAFGSNNIASATGAFVGGGTGNTSSAIASTIGGGQNNTVSATESFIGAGDTNEVTDADSFIGAGTSNSAASGTSAIVAGVSNSTGATSTFIGAGQLNSTGAVRAGVVAGDGNAADGRNSFIGGGNGNTVSADSTAILNGVSCIVDANCNYSAIVSGHSHEITDTALASVICGGGYNSGAAPNRIQASSGGSPGSNNAIIAGYSNTIDQNGIGNNLIGAGALNGVNGSGANYNFIGAGIANQVTSCSNAFIGAGRENEIDGDTGGVICGGGGSGTGNTITSNVATTPTCFIGGGTSNSIVADDPTGSCILGGTGNQITKSYGTILGGQNNRVFQDADYGTVVGAYAAARSYGEVAIGAGQITSGRYGSAQQSTLVFSADLAGGTSSTAIGYLDGVSQTAFMRDNSLLYVTLNMVITDKSDTIYFGAKRTYLLRCSAAGAVSAVGSGSATDVVDPSGESWTFQIGTGTNSWNVRAVRGAGVPGTDRVMVCVATGTQVIPV